MPSVEANPLDPDLDPWERQPRESDGAYASFIAYRDMEKPRSGRRLAVQIGQNPSTVAEKSKRWQWLARVRAWDAHLQEKHDLKLVDLRRQAAERHAMVAAGHLDAMSRPMMEIVRRVKQNPDLLHTMPLEQLLRVEQACARATPRLIAAERLALGATTAHVGLHDPVRAAELDAQGRSDSELDDLLTRGGITDDYVAGYREGKQAGETAAAADPAIDAALEDLDRETT